MAFFPGLFPNLVLLCLTLFLSFHGSFPSKSLLGRCYSGGFNFELGFADLKVQVEVVSWQAELYWTYFINAIAGLFPISWQIS